MITVQFALGVVVGVLVTTGAVFVAVWIGTRPPPHVTDENGEFD